MAKLMIAIGKESPKGKDAKASDLMGGSDDEELDEFSSALDDAFEAVKSDDKEAFKDALGAAIAAKCAEMAGDYDASSGED